MGRYGGEQPSRKQRALAITALLCVVCMLGMSGCARLDAAAVQNGLKESPYYHLGDTWWEHGGIEEYCFNQIPSSLNEIYRELYERFRSYEDEAYVYAAVSTEDFWTAYYALLADHPEFFWVGANIEVEESALTGKVVHYAISSTVPVSQRDEMALRLQEAADECIFGIEADATDYRKIRYVYEYLVNTVDYRADAPSSQNVQSALLSHASVCAGYARSFQYILHRMGMFCTYVTGKTVNGGDHAWNIVRMDDQYYNVDVTWGDPVFVQQEEGESPRHISSINYNYLCCSDAELAPTHVAQAVVELPQCLDEGYNYYKLEGMYYETFHREAIYDALMNSVWSDAPSVTMKFGDTAGYREAMEELFSGGLVNDAAQYLMQVYGVSTWNYSYQTDDDFRLITIYWKE